MNKSPEDGRPKQKEKNQIKHELFSSQASFFGNVISTERRNLNSYTQQQDFSHAFPMTY
jgi:hypothetical protein